MVPETRYARTLDGFDIAYQVVGEGPLDILMIPAWVSHLEIAWENPLYARFMRRAASFARVITYDKRGTGLSSRLTNAPDLEARLDDARAVLDSIGSQRVAIWGDGSDGAALGMLHAASFPTRTSALVLWEPSARNAWAPDHPWGPTREEFESEQQSIRSSWGTREWGQTFAGEDAPSLRTYPELLDSYAKYFRFSATPSDALLFNEIWFDTDVRDLLAAVRVPTLVLARDAPGRPEANEATYVAERIPGATLVRVEGRDFPKWLGDQAAVVDEVRAFLTGVRLGPEPDRVLTTVVFTDIVGSTEVVAERGDAAWRDLVERHHTIVRTLLGTFRGVEVDTAGDGFFATFDGPTRAVRCGHAIRTAVRDLGVEVRVGVHTGEVDVGGEKATGIAVVVGSRIGSVAGPGEVLVSSTVKRISSQDRGSHSSMRVSTSSRESQIAGVSIAWCNGHPFFGPGCTGERATPPRALGYVECRAPPRLRAKHVRRGDGLGLGTPHRRASMGSSETIPSALFARPRSRVMNASACNRVRARYSALALYVDAHPN